MYTSGKYRALLAHLYAIMSSLWVVTNSSTCSCSVQQSGLIGGSPLPDAVAEAAWQQGFASMLQDQLVSNAGMIAYGVTSIISAFK